jgi:ketosteroid isomerase-like protein
MLARLWDAGVAEMFQRAARSCGSTIARANGDEQMDDKYLINVARSEYREAYNTADIDRLLAVCSDNLVDMSDGEPSFYGPEAKQSLRLRLAELLTENTADMVVVISDYAVFGDFAFEWGWETLTLTPKLGGVPTHIDRRYCAAWSRESDGQWRISFQLNNRNVPSLLLEERYRTAMAAR